MKRPILPHVALSGCLLAMLVIHTPAISHSSLDTTRRVLPEWRTWSDPEMYRYGSAFASLYNCPIVSSFSDHPSIQLRTGNVPRYTWRQWQGRQTTDFTFVRLPFDTGKKPRIFQRK